MGVASLFQVNEDLLDKVPYNVCKQGRLRLASACAQPDLSRPYLQLWDPWKKKAKNLIKLRHCEDLAHNCLYCMCFQALILAEWPKIDTLYFDSKLSGFQMSMNLNTWNHVNAFVTSNYDCIKCMRLRHILKASQQFLSNR